MRAKHSKPNKLALRVLSTAAVMAMVTSIAAPAFADAYGIAVYGSYYVDRGNVTVEGNKVTFINDDGEKETKIDTDDEIIITNEDKSKSTDNTVTVKNGTITISNVNIDASKTGKAAVSTEGNVTIELDGNNKLTSGSGRAGLETSTDDSKLTIKDDNKNAGSLDVTGGSLGAGIGGGGFRGTADITITGGKITACAGDKATDSQEDPYAIGNGSMFKDNYFKDGDGASKVTINGDDDDTIVNAIASDKEHAISQLQNITVDSLGEVHKVLINMRGAGGKILKAIHNRAYVGYPADAEEAEAHAWDGGVIIREATPTRKGLKLYTCTVDGCGATKAGEYDYEWLNVSVIFWDAANNAAAPAYLQGKTLNVENTAATVAATQADSVLADKAHWKMAENAGELEIHPATDAAGTIYEQAVKASGCQYYVIANVTAQ